MSTTIPEFLQSCGGRSWCETGLEFFAYRTATSRLRIIEEQTGIAHIADDHARLEDLAALGIDADAHDGQAFADALSAMLHDLLSDDDMVRLHASLGRQIALDDAATGRRMLSEIRSAMAATPTTTPLPLGSLLVDEWNGDGFAQQMPANPVEPSVRPHPLDIENTSKDGYSVMSKGHHDPHEFMRAVRNAGYTWSLGMPVHKWVLAVPTKLDDRSCVYVFTEPHARGAFPATYAWEAHGEDRYEALASSSWRASVLDLPQGNKGGPI